MSWCCIPWVPCVGRSVHLHGLRDYIFLRLGTFSAVTSSMTRSISFSLPSSSGTPIMWILFHLDSSHSSFSILSLLEILFFPWVSASFYSSSLISLPFAVSSTTSDLLLNPSIVCFILDIVYFKVFILICSLRPWIFSVALWAYLWFLFWNLYQEDWWFQFHVALFLVLSLLSCSDWNFAFS